MNSENAPTAKADNGVRIVDRCGMRISNQNYEYLTTLLLGSGIALSLYDPANGIGGVIHCVLPSAKVDATAAENHPQMFVDTGVPALLDEMIAAGAQREQLIAKIGGGAVLLSPHEAFNLGERNSRQMREVLQKLGIPIKAEWVGNTISCTLALDMPTGKTAIQMGDQEVIL